MTVDEIKQSINDSIKARTAIYNDAQARMTELDAEDKANRKRYIEMLGKKYEVGSDENKEFVKVNTRFGTISEERDQQLYVATRALIEIETCKEILSQIEHAETKREAIQEAIKDVLQPLYNQSKWVEVSPKDVQEQADKYGVELNPDEEWLA